MKVAALFPGQGAQYVGMGRWLYDTFPLAKNVFEEASEFLKMDIAELCFNGTQDELSRTEITQPLVLTAGVAAAEVIKSETGIKFAYGVGHSLGEYTALTAAGSLRLQDAVVLVHLRGKYMQEAVAEGNGGMSVINGLDEGEVEAVCMELRREGKQIEISNYNSPYQIVISGERKAVEDAGRIFAEKKATVIPLKVSAPFHCSLMEPAANKMEQALKKVEFQQLKFPVIANVTGVPYFNQQHIKESLVAQMTKAVEWRKSMQFLYLNGVDVAIDMGPGNVVKNLLTRNYAGIRSLSLEKQWLELGELC